MNQKTDVDDGDDGLDVGDDAGFGKDDAAADDGAV